MTEHPDTFGLATPVGSRRKFFEWVTAAAFSLIGLGLAIPLVGYVVSPALRRREQPWVEVGSLDELPLEQPKQLQYLRSEQDGYMPSNVTKAVWAIKHSATDVTVLSPICTHLGCGYNWDEEADRFKCPCHGSVYDKSGKVLGGPAPRPLDPLPTRIEEGRLLVQYKEFKSGLATRVEV